MHSTKTQPTHRKLLLALALAALCGGASAAPLDDHPRAAGRVDERVARMAETLDLTDTQQAEVRRLIADHHARGDAERAALREQIDAVLTPAQRATREQRRGERAEGRLARLPERLAARLDLTDSQREQVAAILQEKRDDPSMTPATVRERMAAVLTPEQQARLREMRGRRSGERGAGERGAGGRDAPPDDREPLF